MLQWLNIYVEKITKLFEIFQIIFDLIWKILYGI